MREIRFRAWNKDTKSMDYNPTIDGFEVGIVALNNFAYQHSSKIILMQSTGLKDENGVEIYDGDVFGLLGGDVERPNEYEFHAKVYFDNDFSAFCVELYNGGWEYLSDYLDNPKNEREVIGNIYENPELVK